MKRFLKLAIFAFLFNLAHTDVAIAQDLDAPKGVRYVNVENESVLTLSRSPAYGRNSPQYQIRTSGSATPISLTRSLGARGDVLFKDKDGIIRLRTTLLGGNIYYPNDTPKGVPLLKSQNAPDVQIQTAPKRTLTDWEKAYPYKGQNPAQSGS